MRDTDPTSSDQIGFAPRAVCYSITADERFPVMALNSIKTLRYHNAHIPIHCFLFGHKRNNAIAAIEQENVHIVVRPKASAHGRYFIKWEAVSHMNSNAVLFLDADTVIFDDVEKVFTRCKKASFYARKEVGTEKRIRGITFDKRWRHVRSQVDWDLYEKIARQIGARVLPIFNTGVMLFNADFHKKIRVHRSLFTKIHDRFRSGQLRYPCRNPHLVEEITASLVLGGMNRFSFAHFTKKTTTWHVENRGKEISDRGIICHAWTYYYNDMLKELNFI